MANRTEPSSRHYDEKLKEILKRSANTSRGVKAEFQRLLLKRSGAERIKMGCSMHAAAQALVKAALPRKRSASPARLKQYLFLRFYGHEFDAESRKRILDALKKS